MSTPVLATKLFAPVLRPRLVGRPRLTGQLDTTLDVGHRLTLVSAPAGFGKTTVLGDWLSDLDRRLPNVRVGWLSLDDADNDLARLLTHLVAALRGVGLDVDPAVVDLVPGGPTAGAPVVTALTSLVNDISRAGAAQAGEQRVLVLDDYHAIESAAVHEVVSFLVDHLPDQLRLVVATRADPPLPLARLRSRGQLTELRAADLRFTPAEAREFLVQAMGLELAAADADALGERTEGWVAGLQLAALSLSGVADRGDVAAFVEAFAGSNRFVLDYLVDEVLARQPPQVREFLLGTAVLDQLSGPLCDAVTGSADGAEMLDHLDRSNLFLVPLDAERSWYRFHHLFADVLRARLRAEAPEQVPAMHHRASEWFAVHGRVADAVRHALAAGDFDRAAFLMEQALPELRRTRQDSLLLTWMDSLPEPVVRRSPVLSIVTGWALLMSGDLDAVDPRLDDAEAALAAGAADDRLAATWADTEDLRTAPAMVSVYRASLAQARGDVAGTVRHARRAVELAGPQDHFVRGAGAGFLGLAAWADGDVAGALATFTEGVRHLHAAGNLVDELDATVVRADMCVVAGRPGRARLLCEQALRSAAESRVPSVRAAADLHVSLAELDRERGDLTSAETHLETARALGERASITENRHRWFVVRAQVCAARGDHDTALRLLDQAEALYRPGFYPDVRPIAATRARVHVAAGDLWAALRWAQDRDLGVGDEPVYLREYEHLTLVRLLLAQHRAAQPDGGAGATVPTVALLGLLDRLHRAAAAAGRVGSVVEIRVLQALVHHADGDLPRALDALDGARSEALEPDSYVRLYLDEGAAMTTLLRQAATGRAGHQALRQQARWLLGPTTTPAAGAPQQLPEPLSTRELDVLRLLDTDLTGPEIARELYVTLNTLRTHTRRIFTKLDARTRAAAVRRAHEHGLL